MLKTRIAPRALFAIFLATTASACAHGASSGETTDAVPAPRAAAASSVTAQDVQQRPSERVEEILRGRIAGVMVTQTPDGGLAVRVRGASSLQGNEAPLYLLDGVPVDPGPYGSLVGINPYDIESIKVLKDPASLTLYGARGANGVVVIKTKRGRPQ